MYIKPVTDGHISSEYGPRELEIDGVKYHFHCGIDIGPSKENPNPEILCPCDGILWVHGWSNTFGWRSWIKIKEGEYKDLYLVLAHMDSIDTDLHAYDNIKAGTVLGIMGNTGLTKAKHTHLGLRLNPSMAEISANCPNPKAFRALYQ